MHVSHMKHLGIDLKPSDIRSELRAGSTRTLTFCEAGEVPGEVARHGRIRVEMSGQYRGCARTTVEASIQAKSVGLMTITECHYTCWCFVTEISFPSSSGWCTVHCLDTGNYF